MPWLPLYMDDQDTADLLSWLNDETHIAFIIPDGAKRWKAVSTVATLSPRNCLWHTDSGSLPLLTETSDLVVDDPWSGWTEQRTGANPTTPYFGAGHPGIYWLNHRRDDSSTIALSSFEWIGNHYRIIGNPAPPSTEKWWARLRRRIKKTAVRVPRTGPVGGANPEIWALPNALAAIQSGAERSPNP